MTYFIKISPNFDRRRILEECSDLLSNHIEPEKHKTNIKDLSALTQLPIFLDDISKQFLKAKSKYEEAIEHLEQQEALRNNNEIIERPVIHIDVGYVIKLMIRTIIMILLFKSYFKGPIFYFLIIAIGIYFV